MLRKYSVLIWFIKWVGGARSRFKECRDGGKVPRERAGWQQQSFVMEFGDGEVVQFILLQVEARPISSMRCFEKVFDSDSTVASTRT